jgi:hypothetical protein
MYSNLHCAIFALFLLDGCNVSGKIWLIYVHRYRYVFNSFTLFLTYFAIQDSTKYINVVVKY